MPKRIAAFLVVVILLTGLRSAEAQPAQSTLSATAQALTKYLLTQNELPAGFRPTSPPIEGDNEDIVTAPGNGADIAPVVVASRRMTEVGFTSRGATALPTFAHWIGAFADADGAWYYASNYVIPFSIPNVEKTLPGPEVGERSVLYRYVTGLGASAVETHFLIFQRDRLEVEVVWRATPGMASLDDLVDLARAIDAKIIASPPGPPTAGDLALIEEPTPSVLVRNAVAIFETFYIDEIDPAVLLREAWEGAARALASAGVADVPAPPPYPTGNAQAAIALHMRSFAALEGLAGNALTQAQLAEAALREMARQRNDCHTVYLNPAAWQRFKASLTGGEQVIIGFSSTKESPDSPLIITAITPNSPARAAGMRRGQEILAINGRSVAGLTTSEALDLLDRREGAVNVITVRNPSGSVLEIRVAPGRVTIPPLETEILPGNIGVIRLYTFETGSRQIELVRQALESFEAQGIEGWIFDLRNNPGGSAATTAALLSFFLESGRLYGSVARGEAAQFVSASGDVLPFQRPMAILIGKGSASAADIFPGVLQARGRAVLVGERTAGCVGSFLGGTGLLDGSEFHVTFSETVIGPDAIRYHRVGVPPNVEVATPTPEEDEAGIDRQIDAAVEVLRQLIGPPSAAVPQPESPKKGTSVTIWS